MNSLAKLSATLAAVSVSAANGVAVADSDFTATGTGSTNGSVQAVCLIGPATLAFGTFVSFSASGTAAAPGVHTANANVAVPVSCTAGTQGKVYVTSNAVTLHGTGANSETLTANLSAVSSGGTAFPTTGSSGVAYTGTGTAGTLNVYGRIVTKTTTIADAYSGSTTIKIDYQSGN